MDNKSTLDKFGHGFQVKVLSCLLKDRSFVSQIIDISPSSYFDSKAHVWLVDAIFDYFREYRLVPTLDVFKVQISNINQETFQVEVKAALKEVWTNMQSDDLEYVKDQWVQSCRHQEMKKAFEESFSLLEAGEYDEIVKRFNIANSKGILEQNVGLDFMQDVDARYSEQMQPKRISTGWDILDDLLGGGMPVGKLGVFIAGPGGTKSWHLMVLGAAAMKLGFNVLHYTLELDEIYVGKRYDSIVSSIPLDDLDFHIPELKRKLENIKGNIKVKFFPTKSVSINGIKQHIERTTLNGFVPDLIIIDYADLLKVNQNPNLRKDEQLQELYEEMRGLAGTLNVPIWTASQINRSQVSSDVIDGDAISESFGKMFTADFVASISRKSKDKINNTGRMHIIKNRMGPDGLVFPERIDTSKGLIEIYNERSDSGKKVKDDMISDEQYSQQLGSKRFEQIMNKNRTEPNKLF